ncbi:MAG TPA: GNAT family N-acetyltransferase, partial [Thermomicrobiales bacterium]|nr:GNAT family N-acetyltransferase [Thermomicrobiales bacterium]
HLDAMLDAFFDDREPVIGFQGPAYRFPATISTTIDVTRISRENLHLLHRVVGDLDALDRDFDVVEPWMAVVQDGAAVATCYSCRRSDRAAQARVDTAPPFRGRGYAPAMVAAWAREVRATGRIPLYGTTWDNLASQAVARKLGLVQFGVSLALP